MRPIRNDNNDNLGIIFPIINKTYVVTSLLNRITKTGLMRGHNIRFRREMKQKSHNYLQKLGLSGALIDIMMFVFFTNKWILNFSKDRIQCHMVSLLTFSDF